MFVFNQIVFITHQCLTTYLLELSLTIMHLHRPYALLSLSFFSSPFVVIALIAQSCLDSFETPWTVAYQVSLSMGFSRQEYWSGLPFPSPLSLS